MEQFSEDAAATRQMQEGLGVPPADSRAVARAPPYCWAEPMSMGPAIPGEDWLLRHWGWEVFLGMTVLSLEFCTISELCFRHHCHSWVQPGWTKTKHNSSRYAFLSIFSQICSLLTERHHPTLRNTEVKLNYFGNLMHFRMGAQVWTGCFCHLWIKHR